MERWRAYQAWKLHNEDVCAGLVLFAVRNFHVDQKLIVGSSMWTAAIESISSNPHLFSYNGLSDASGLARKALSTIRSFRSMASWLLDFTRGDSRVNQLHLRPWDLQPFLQVAGNVCTGGHEDVNAVIAAHATYNKGICIALDLISAGSQIGIMNNMHKMAFDILRASDVR